VNTLHTAQSRSSAVPFSATQTKQRIKSAKFGRHRRLFSCKWYNPFSSWKGLHRTPTRTISRIISLTGFRLSFIAL